MTLAAYQDRCDFLTRLNYKECTGFFTKKGAQEGKGGLCLDLNEEFIITQLNQFAVKRNVNI